jgi:hypothetical protein
MATMHINRGGTNLGTFSEEEVRAGLRAGRFVGTDLGWRDGMPVWKPLSQFAEFTADFPPAVPPVPPVPPPAGEAAAPAPGSPLPGPVTPPAALQTVTEVGARAGLPWDHRDQIGFVRAFIETLQMVLVRPTEAFTAMRREGGLGGPLLYAVIGGTFGAVVQYIYNFGLRLAGGSFDNYSNRFLGSTSLLVLLICSPLIVVIVLFVISALIHVCLLIVGGARYTFETTFRVICFAAGSANPLQIVPFCGGLVAAIWGIVLYCIGLARAHEIEPGRAVLAVFLPLVLCCGGCILLIILGGGLAALTHGWR